jgi:hypothetical protein
MLLLDSICQITPPPFYLDISPVILALRQTTVMTQYVGRGGGQDGGRVMGLGTIDWCKR